jgi:4'-phosphopantetheinyl transferase
MTSINFLKKQILSKVGERLPDRCDDGQILLVTAGLSDFQQVLVSDEEHRRSAIMEAMTSRRFLAARRLTRAMFSRLLGLDPDQVEIGIDQHGKPYLPNREYHFSIAHSGGSVAVAISRSEIGLDLEPQRSLDHLALAKRFFSPEEASWLERNSDPSQFFRLWTCREAAVKADGRGLAQLLGQMSVLATPPDEVGCTRVCIGTREWSAWHLVDSSRLHLALAFPRLPSLISWCDLRREGIF